MISISPRRRAGFTLVELLVVIGIIALLAGILLPMLSRMMRTANRTRIAADINTIGTALEAYKQDFGDYPPVEEPGTGFAVLGKALGSPFGTTAAGFAPGPTYRAGDCAGTLPNVFVVKIDSTTAAPSTGTDWAAYSPLDGADGPGFRTRQGGQIHRPYLEAGKLKFRGLAILDHYDNPILYFPKSHVQINLAAAGGLLVANGTTTAMYNYADNGSLFRSLTADPSDDTKALARMRVMMGDVTDNSGTGVPDGAIEAGQGESAGSTGPYLLWSAGPDGNYGTHEDMTDMSLSAADRHRLAGKSDDVTNFNMGQ